MRATSWLVGLSILPTIAGCGPMNVASKTYSFQSANAAPQSVSVIAGKAEAGEGVLVIRSIDEKDTRTDPLLQNAINAYPNLDPPLAPKKVTVDSGEHTIGVLYFFFDALFDDPKTASLWWGKYLSKNYSIQMKQKYAPDLTFGPDNRDHVVTVKHFEKLRFNCDAGATCVIYPVFNTEKTSVQLAVKECDSSLGKCHQIESTSTATKIAVVSKQSYTDI